MNLVKLLQRSLTVTSFNLVNVGRKKLCNCQNNFSTISISKVTFISGAGEHGREFKTGAVINQKLEALPGEKILKVKLKSRRVDAVMKAGLAMSRNKIEKVFYDDRVRINGERPKKKSQVIYEGDEIDIVRGSNKLNPDFIDVNRIEIAELGEDMEEEDSDGESDSDDEKSTRIPAVIKRSKMLTIKNYDQPWKGNNSED